MSEKDKFCPNCGTKAAKSVNKVKKEKNEAKNPLPKADSTAQGGGQPKSVKAVKHIYYDKDGKQIKNPNVETHTEGVIQGMMVACIAIALIIVTIAGSMFISGNLLDDTFDNAFAAPASSTASEDNSEVSSEDISSQEVSSNDAHANEQSSNTVSSIPDELLAANLKKKIVGKWEASLPYKSMSLPATFTFDESGDCSCIIKALFISQKFEGSYKVDDGGSCSITLNGIEEYIGKSNTLKGNATFISDDELEFAADGTVWKLKRVS